MPRVDDALEFARTTRVFLLRHEASGVELDVSVAGLAFEYDLIERATVQSVKGVTFKVAAPEDILVMKCLALRPRDIADIEGILTVRENLDLERVRMAIREFSVALESEDFLSEFEAIVRRVKASSWGT
jgi:predicted nucleotidyltransferase